MTAKTLDPITRHLISMGALPSGCRLAFVDKIEDAVFTQYRRVIEPRENWRDDLSYDVDIDEHVNAVTRESMLDCYDRIWRVPLVRDGRGRVKQRMVRPPDRLGPVLSCDWLQAPERAEYSSQYPHVAAWFEVARPFRFLFEILDEVTHDHLLPFALTLGPGGASVQEAADAARAAYRFGRLGAVAECPLATLTTPTHTITRL